MSARILIIEDNAANLELMTYLLHAYQYETLSASDGEAGLKLARRELPEVIVCDIQLPRMDGYQVVRALKSDAATQAIPVVAVTAFAMVGDKERIMRAGFDGYIGKPIVPETFVPQIEQFLKTKSGAQPVPTHGASTGRAGRKADALGVRILVVDNTPANLDLFVSMLEPLGYEVVATSNVADAFARAKQQIPDLIISDVHMPGESGFDFLARVKADPALREVPFMLASATSWDDAAGHQAARAGADLFLMRPVDPERLLGQVKKLLASRKPPRGHDTDR